MNDLRQIEMALSQYAEAHDGRFPDNLEQIMPLLGTHAQQVWNDPLRPNQTKPYVYLRPADRVSQVTSPSTAIVLYENHTTWDQGIAAAFADGHVEWFSDEDAFQRQLDRTKKDNPGAVEVPR